MSHPGTSSHKEKKGQLASHWLLISASPVISQPLGMSVKKYPPSGACGRAITRVKWLVHVLYP